VPVLPESDDVSTAHGDVEQVPTFHKAALPVCAPPWPSRSWNAVFWAITEIVPPSPDFVAEASSTVACRRDRGVLQPPTVIEPPPFFPEHRVWRPKRDSPGPPSSTIAPPWSLTSGNHFARMLITPVTRSAAARAESRTVRPSMRRCWRPAPSPAAVLVDRRGHMLGSTGRK